MFERIIAAIIFFGYLYLASLRLGDPDGLTRSHAGTAGPSWNQRSKRPMFGPLAYLVAGIMAVYFGLLNFLIQTG